MVHDGNKEVVDVTKSTSESNKKNSFIEKLRSAIVDPFRHQKNRKINVKSLVSPQFTLDKILVFIETSNRFLNGNTNFTRFDKLMRSYDRLYTSDGMNAANTFFNMCVSFWTVVDAVANIFRAYETRYLNAKDENQPPEPNPLEDLQASLDDANNNIAIVSDLFQTIGRMGELDDIFAESDRDDDEDNSAPILKRTLLQGKLQEADDNDDEYDNGRDDDANNEVENTKESLHSEKQQINVQQKYPPELSAEKNRHDLSHPAHVVGGNSANNRQTLYSEQTDRKEHFNLLGPFQQIRRFSMKSDSYSKINIQSATKTIIVQPPNLELQKAINDRVVHTLIRNKRSNLGQYDFGIDRFVYVMTKMNNVLNSNTNNRQLNRFTRAFNDLFASDGLSAFNGFYTLLASFWTIVDAVANVFRFNEARIRDQIQQNQAENQPDPLADLQTELDDTNANLEEVAELVTTLDAAAGARVDNVAGNEFRRSGVKNKKKKKKTAGSRRKKPSKPSIPTTPQPTRHFYNPVTRGSYHHIQPALSSSWQPMDRNWSPINPQSPVETNRNFYYPVVYSGDNLSNRQNNPLPPSTLHRNFSPILNRRSTSVGHQMKNPQHSLIPAVNRHAMNYDNNPVIGRLSHLQSSSEINRHIYPVRNDDYIRKYSSRTGLHPSTVSGQRYRKSSAIVQPKRK